MPRSTKAAHDAEVKATRSRLAAQRTCTCGAPVLEGRAGSCAVRKARVDLRPLTPSDEAAAAILGRSTYSVWPTKDGVELERRSALHMRTPAGIRTVVAEHSCRAPLGDPTRSLLAVGGTTYADGPAPY